MGRLCKIHVPSGGTAPSSGVTRAHSRTALELDLSPLVPPHGDHADGNPLTSHNSLSGGGSCSLCTGEETGSGRPTVFGKVTELLCHGAP